MADARKSFYELIPRYYRYLDSKQGGPLSALAQILQNQLDAVEANIGQLYDDWYIQTCQAWVVPYIGELLGLDLNDQTYFLPNQRAWVANAMRYRRRKGVAYALQPQIWDATGWYARVVQRFPYLAQTQSMAALKPLQGHTVDVTALARRNWIDTPFDSAAHRPGFASPFASPASYNLPTIAIYLWRLLNYLVQEVPPRSATDASDSGVKNRFHFNPLGFDIPLFDFPEGAIPSKKPTAAKNLPAPIEPLAFASDLDLFRQTHQNTDPLPANTTYYGPERALNISILEKIPFSEATQRANVNPIAIYPMAMPDWERPPADTILSLCKTKEYPDDLPDFPAVSVSMDQYGPFLAQMTSNPQNWDQLSIALAKAIQKARVLDQALLGMIVEALGDQLLMVSGFSAATISFRPVQDNPLILQQLHLETDELRTAFRSGNLAIPLTLTSTEPTMKISAKDHPTVLADMGATEFSSMEALATTLQTAIRNATPDNHSILGTKVFSDNGRLQVFSGTDEFPQFYQGLDDAETVSELGLEVGTGSLLEKMNNPPLGIQFEKVILSGQLLPGSVEVTEPASFYFSLNNQAGLVKLPPMTIDDPESLDQAAAIIQTAIRETEYDQTRPFYDVVVESFQASYLLVKAPSPIDLINIYPSSDPTAIQLELLEGERGVLISSYLGTSINLSNPNPHLELMFLNSPVVNIQLAPMTQPVSIEIMAERLQEGIVHAAILDSLYQDAQVQPIENMGLVVIPGLANVRFQFTTTPTDPWTVPQLKLDDAIDYRPRLSISGNLPPEDFPMTLAPMADVTVIIDPFLPMDAIINPDEYEREVYDLRDMAGSLQNAIQMSDTPAYQASLVEVWGDQMVTLSGLPFHNILYSRGNYSPETVEQLKLQDPAYILLQYGLRSGDLGTLPLSGLPASPQVNLAQGDQGPHLVNLDGIDQFTDIAELAASIQTQIRSANPDFMFIAVIGRSYQRNRLQFTELLFAGTNDLFFTATPDDPTTVEVLKLQLGGRQATLSGELNPFPVFAGQPPQLGVNVDETPFIAQFPSVPQNMNQMARLMQLGIRHAYIELRAFNQCRVFNLPGQAPIGDEPVLNPDLFIQPGTRGMRTNFKAAPNDKVTYRALGLNSLIQMQAALSGDLFPFPHLNIGNSMTITIGQKTGDLDPPSGQIYLETELNQISQAAVWLERKIHDLAIPGTPEEVTWKETRVIVEEGQLLVLPGPWIPNPLFDEVQYGPIRFTTGINDIGTLSYTILLNNMVAIDAARGRLSFALNVTVDSPLVTYNYGFSGAIGAGPFYKPGIDRSYLQTYPVGQKLALKTFKAAIDAWEADGRPQARILFSDNGIYRELGFQLKLNDRDFLIIEAVNYTNPVLITKGPLEIQTSQGSAELNWLSMTLQGQLIFSGSGRLTSNFSYCTLLPLPKSDPDFQGIENAPVIMAGGESTSIALSLNLCIAGPLRLPTYGLTLEISNSILNPYARSFPESMAIAGLDDTPGPETTIINTTVFGKAAFYILKQATNVIFNQPIQVLNSQTGIVRFSYVPLLSKTPLCYRCQPDLALIGHESQLPKPIYTSVVYPQPGFAQLASACDARIAHGGANGGEMGAFQFLRQPNRETLLNQVLAGNLPLGRDPDVFILT